MLNFCRYIRKFIKIENYSKPFTPDKIARGEWFPISTNRVFCFYSEWKWIPSPALSAKNRKSRCSPGCDRDCRSRGLHTPLFANSSGESPAPQIFHVLLRSPAVLGYSASLRCIPVHPADTSPEQRFLCSVYALPQSCPGSTGGSHSGSEPVLRKPSAGKNPSHGYSSRRYRQVVPAV